MQTRTKRALDTLRAAVRGPVALLGPLALALMIAGSWGVVDMRSARARLERDRAALASARQAAADPPAGEAEPGLVTEARAQLLLSGATRLELLARDAGVEVEAVTPREEEAVAVAVRGRGDARSVARFLSALEHPRERLALRRCRVVGAGVELQLELELELAPPGGGAVDREATR